MTDYHTGANQSSPTDHSTADPATGRDTSDSRASDTHKTQIGSGDSSRTDAREVKNASDVADDRTVYLPRATTRNADSSIHSTPRCASFSPDASTSQGPMWYFREKHSLCKRCWGPEPEVRAAEPDQEIVTDGGTQGAVDHDYGDAERDASERLGDRIAEMDGRGHDRLQPGDVAIDLVKRQPLFVLDRVADTVVDYYDAEDFDLATYNQHHYLPVRPTDPVFECAFIGGLEDLHRFSDTYSYPAGRLARVPVELAGGAD